MIMMVLLTDEPAPAEQHTGIGKWGKKLAGGFSKLGH